MHAECAFAELVDTLLIASTAAFPSGDATLARSPAAGLETDADIATISIANCAVKAALVAVGATQAANFSVAETATAIVVSFAAIADLACGTTRTTAVNSVSSPFLIPSAQVGPEGGGGGPEVIWAAPEEEKPEVIPHMRPRLHLA